MDKDSFKTAYTYPNRNEGKWTLEGLPQNSPFGGIIFRLHHKFTLAIFHINSRKLEKFIKWKYWNAGVQGKNNEYHIVDKVQNSFIDALIFDLIDNVVFVVFALYSRMALHTECGYFTFWKIFLFLQNIYKNFFLKLDMGLKLKIVPDSWKWIRFWKFCSCWVQK